MNEPVTNNAHRTSPPVCSAGVSPAGSPGVPPGDALPLATAPPAASCTELLLLPNGEILVHNLTPALARLLAELDAADGTMRQRAGCEAPSLVRQPTIEPRSD